MGGAGSAVNEFILQNKLSVQVLNLGLPDHYVHHGTQESLLCQLGLDANSIKKSILVFCEK